MEQSLKGIRGIVTDFADAQPVKAKIFILNIPTAFVKTDSIAGDYHRMILPGNYSVIFTAPGYVTDTVHNVPVTDSIATRLDHQMRRSVTNITTLENSLPQKSGLYNNYPNPFNPVTHLEFGISDLGFVSLKVYDILGKEVAVLVNQKLLPGRYKVKFNGSYFASGVYLYKLESGNFSETKRMMLLK